MEIVLLFNFPPKFGVHTKGIVPRQALSHLCILQGVVLVQDMHAYSLFSLSWTCWASYTPTSNSCHPGRMQRFKANPSRLFPHPLDPPHTHTLVQAFACFRPPHTHWDRLLLGTPSWQKPGATAFSCRLSM